MDIVSLLGIIIPLVGMSYVFFPSTAFSLLAATIAGAYSGQFLATGWPNIIAVAIYPMSQGNIVAIIGVVFALLLFTTWIDRFRWLARYPTAIMTGTGLGVSLRALVGAQLISQIDMTIMPIITNSLASSFNNFFFVAALCFSLYYFIFGTELKGNWIKVNKAARLFIMVAMGAQAANMTWNKGGVLTPWMSIMDKLNKFIASL